MSRLKFAFPLWLALGVVAFGMQAPFDSSAVTTLARSMTQQLADKNYDAVETHFDSTMSSALPSAKLAQVWQASLAQLGAFQSVDSATEHEEHGFHVVLVTTKFENATINLKWVFGTDGQVAGFFLLPA